MGLKYGGLLLDLNALFGGCEIGYMGAVIWGSLLLYMSICHNPLHVRTSYSTNIYQYILLQLHSKKVLYVIPCQHTLQHHHHPLH